MRSLSLSFIIGVYVRVLNALDLVYFIMGHHKLVQPKMGGGSWGQGEGTGGQLPPPAPTWSRPWSARPAAAVNASEAQITDIENSVTTIKQALTWLTENGKRKPGRFSRISLERHR